MVFLLLPTVLRGSGLVSGLGYPRASKGMGTKTPGHEVLLQLTSFTVSHGYCNPNELFFGAKLAQYPCFFIMVIVSPTY